MVQKQKQQINITKDLKNPFIGLRPFKPEESRLFFGRDDHIEAIVEKLLIEQFVVVTGASGIGKSSIVNCGVIPDIKNRGSFKTIHARIGSTFIDDLLEEVIRITHSSKADKESNSGESRKSRIFKYLRRDHKEERSSYLLFVDQFEQLFLNFGVIGEHRIKEARENYISTIVELIKQADFPVYVIMTMSSDYIGESSQFSEFAELLNKGNYLLPQMEKDNLRRAIEGPLEVSGAEWDHRLVDRILSDLTMRVDRLPLMQHVLQRTFDAWQNSEIAHKPVSVISYENVGTVTEALSNHADDAFDELDKKSKEICERIFRSITSKTPDHRAVRQPATINELSEIIQADEEQIIKIISIFNRQDVSFITPPENVPLKGDTLINISHEALIRNWERLKGWVDEEAASVQMYNKLAHAALQFQLGKGDLWRPPDLELAIKWRDDNKPNLAWGRRHNPAFERTMVFLDLSENEFFLEQENKSRNQKLKQRLTWIVSGVAGVAAILLLILFISSKNDTTESVNNASGVDNEAGMAEIDQLAENQDREEVPVSVAEQERSSEPANTGIQDFEEETDPVREIDQRQNQPVNNDNAFNQAPVDIEVNNPVRQQTEERVEEENIPPPQDNIEENSSSEDNTAEENSGRPEPATPTISKSRMIEISRSLASSSMNVSGDKDLKTLLAFQAYKFNREFNNSAFSYPLYNALYESLKSFGGDFNVYKGHRQTIFTVDYQAGTSSFYTAGSEGKILKWSTRGNNKDFSTLLSGRGIIYELDVSNDGSWLVFSESGKGLFLYNLRSGGNVKEFSGDELNIQAIEIAPDNNTVYTAGTGNYIEAGSISGTSMKKVIETSSRIYSLSVSPDGKYLAGGAADGKVYIWDIENDYRAEVIHNDRSKRVSSLDFSANGNYLACGAMNGQTMLFNGRTFQLIRTLSDHRGRITEVCFSPNSRYLVSASMDNSVVYRSISDLRSEPVVIKDNGGWVQAACFSSNGKYIISGSKDENRLIVTPATLSALAERKCFLVSRNLTQAEWNRYVGRDIPYEKTCENQ